MPAAAVIPAPIAYIKVVAVKKLVVGFLGVIAWSALKLSTGCPPLSSGEPGCLYLTGWQWDQDFYFEEIRVFKAGISP